MFGISNKLRGREVCYNFDMGLKEDVIGFLLEYNRSYADLRKRLYGSRSRGKGIKTKNYSDTLYVILARLKKEGLVEKKNNFWKITSLGKKFFRNNEKIIKHSQREKINKEKKNLIIIFDIPETKRYKRDWLRIELVLLGFEQIQKSVWIGPSALPKSFLENVSGLGILEHLKFFRAESTKII
jgi:DNA-binding PadR family transcriptional regulator